MIEPSTPTDPFDGADFYDDGDGGELTHEYPGDAIMDAVDGVSAGCSVHEAIQKVSPLEITAWARETISSEWRRSMAERLTDVLTESLDDDFGRDPEGSHVVDKLDLQLQIESLLHEELADARPYRCTIVATRTYGPAEVEAILRQECPEWFE